MFRHGDAMKKSYWSALCAWELTVTTILAVLIVAVRPDHMWNESDLRFLSYVAVCGIIVTAAVAFFSRRFGRPGGVAIGVLCGLAPSALMVAWVWMARPGFEESAGTVGVALMLAAPSAIGGAIAGSICSQSTTDTL